MVSDRLRSIVRCPDCRGALAVVDLTAGLKARPTSVDYEATADDGTGSGCETGSTDLTCRSCGRRYPVQCGAFLDLRPSTSFSETTRYLEPALHADARHETVSPPLLSAAIRNDMLRSFLAPGAGDRVLDLGCGNGRALVWNEHLGAYQVGIDLSPYFAREARAQVDLIVGDLRRLPLADEAFTKAFSLDVLEHLSRPSLASVLREAHRVLVPGGAVFVYTHVRKNSPLALGLRAINGVTRGLERLGLIDLRQEHLRKADHLNPLTDIEDFHRVVAEAGFRVARIRYYTPLVGGLVENLLVRLAEGVLVRRAARKRDASFSNASGESLRAVRRQAKARIARRGPTYATLVLLTKLMKLDLLLFGRIRSGPFFALLVKDG